MSRALVLVVGFVWLARVRLMVRARRRARVASALTARNAALLLASQAVVVSMGGLGVVGGLRGVGAGSGLRAGGSVAVVLSGRDASLARVRRQAVVRAARRRRWLGSPAARAQRVVSRMAFHGLGWDASSRLLMSDYGSVIAGASANPAASVAHMGRVVRYLSDDRALVRTAHGLQVETSTAPLRVREGSAERPVDLRLAARGGGFSPARPLTHVWIPREANRGVAVGSGGLRVALEGANAVGRTVGQGVFFAGVGRDMDAVVAPKLDGVELFAVLRSRLSPEEIRYRVTLPAGAVLRAAAGGVVVSRSGEVLARIPAPIARDAQGSYVPVQMRVAGDELLLSVAHRHRDVAYPLLVDPEIITITASSSGWKFEKEPAFRACGEQATIHGTAPGSGEPLSIIEPETSYPLPEAERCEEYPRNYELALGFWGWKATAPPGPAEFYGVSLAASAIASGKEDPEGVYWRLGNCETSMSNDLSSPPPVTVIVVPSSHCTRYTVSVTLEAGEVTKPETPVTVSATLSVEAILLSEYIAAPEESEEYGPLNGGEPHRPKCALGRPVNCAIGNQFETQTDLAVGGRGPALALTRTYNSRQAVGEDERKEHGPFGYGWDGPYSAHITFGKLCDGTVCTETETAKVTQDDGSTVLFEHPHEAWEPANPLVQGTFAKEGTGYVYTLPDQSKLDFNSSGQLTSETDRDGNALTMQYTSGGRLESVTDSAGRKLTFAYNSEGLVESTEDPMGHTVKYGYEGDNLTSVTQPGESALRWQFEYNAEHELTSETDGRGHAVTTEYSSGRVSSQTDALGHTRKWEYGGTFGRESIVTVITEPNGSVTREEFSAEGLPTSVTHAYGTSLAATTRSEYELNGNLIAVTNPDGHTTTFGYNSAGDRTSEVDPDGHETKWTYDPTHDVKTITTPDGETTTFVRNSDGAPETMSVAAPQETRQVAQITNYTYDSHGDLTSVTNPVRHTWQYTYDSQGDRTGETDPEGDTRSLVYNEDSQVTSIVSPRGEVKGAERSKFTTKIERDDQGRPITVTDPLGHTTKYTYNGDGNVETVTDPNGHKTQYTYDADDEPVKVEEPNGTITETEYNSEGQVVGQIDGNKHTTRYMRNLLGEVTEVIDPLGRKTTKEYDKAGNLTGVTDAEKRTTTYTYDPANRLTEISYSDGKTHNVKYEYNGDGYLTKMVDGTGTTTDTYDQFDRPIESKDGHGDTTKYEYNLASQPTKITYPNGKAVTREYDKDGRLEKVNDWLSHTTMFSYDPDSDWTTTTYPTTGTRGEDRDAYNDADQMTEDEMSYGTETRALLVYTRDSDGQVKTITSKGLPGETNPSYTYDANNRLTKAGNSPWEYDAANNPTKIGTRSYAYNSADELETRGGYFYNAVGERTESTPTRALATTYGYDQAGNLTSVKQGKEGETRAISDTYTYNGNGLRASQTSGGTTRYLAWDTEEDTPTILSDETRSYIYGPAETPVEQIGSEGKVLFLHHDQQGSIRMLTGTTGATEATMTYDPYGNLTGSTGTATTPLGYDGQYTSSDTGLIYLRARVYDPATAQFLSVDPLVGLTGAPYNYATDNPLNKADRTGLTWEAELPEGLPCSWPCTPPAVNQGLEEAAQGAEQSIESGWNAITENEEAGDEGEAELRAKEAESACGKIPTGSKPPKAAYRELEKDTGLSKGKLSDALHKLKEHGGVPNNANTRIAPDGNVYDEETGQLIGNIIDEAHG
jgi:RHS repeat-associated protein